MKDAFVAAAEALMKDGFAAIAADLMGRPYTSKIVLLPTQFDLYEVLRDFSYKHSDQDVNNGTYHFKTGEIIRLREEPMYFMPDRSNLEYLGKIKVFR